MHIELVAVMVVGIVRGSEYRGDQSWASSSVLLYGHSLSSRTGRTADVAPRCGLQDRASRPSGPASLEALEGRAGSKAFSYSAQFSSDLRIFDSST